MTNHEWSMPIEGGPYRWTWASTTLTAEVRPQEIRICTEELAGSPIDLHRVMEPTDPPETVERFARNGTAAVRLTARAADRSVIVRPAQSLTVLGGATAQIYVSTPIWVGMQRDGDPEPFFEVPCTRPSNTWFGDTPQAGELAYASKSRARSRLEQLQFRPGRAITSITLVNGMIDPWNIVRLTVPCPHLALFHTPSGLWTPSIQIQRGVVDEATVTVEKAPPEEAGESEQVSEPRLLGAPRFLLQALGSLGWN